MQPLIPLGEVTRSTATVTAGRLGTITRGRARAARLLENGFAETPATARIKNSLGPKKTNERELEPRLGPQLEWLPLSLSCDRVEEAAQYRLVGVMERRTRVIPVRIGHDKTVQVQVTGRGGERDVGILDHLPSFEELTEAIEGISSAMLGALEKAKPHSATVEFGLDVAFEEGQLTALLVQGSGTASVKITLQWGGE